MLQVQVPLPDLSCFNRLLDDSASSGDSAGQGVVIAAAEASCEKPITKFFT